MPRRSPTLTIRITGTPSLHVSGHAVPALRHRKGYALVYYLAANLKPVPRSELTKLLWGGLPEDHGRNNLRVVLTDLRKKLGDYLDVRRGTLALRDDATVHVDLHAFRQWARRDAPYGRIEGSEAWNGSFLDGFAVEGSDAFNAWAFAFRDDVREEAQRAFIYAAEAAEVDGRDGDVIAMLRRSLDTTPWDEATHRRLIQHLASRGQYAAARMQFEACRRALERHLGIAPSRDALDTLERALRHPDRDGHGRTRPPTAGSPLHGRDEQLTALRTLLRDPECVLISVVGLPGTGRSNLVREALDRERFHHPEAVLTVSLHDARSDEAVWQRVAANLDAFRGDQADATPGSLDHEAPEDPFSAIASSIAATPTLLVLDDVEPDVTLRAPITSLLATCPNLRIVHVADRPIGTLQERTVVVPLLPVPNTTASGTIAELEAREPSVAVLLEFARRADATFTIPDDHAPDVVRFTRDVGGHPVALMLAGRRLPTESIGTLVKKWAHPQLGIVHTREGSVDPLGRHGSLAETFEPILRRVAGMPRHILAALAMFHSPVSLAAIAEVAGVSEDVVERVLETFVRERWVVRTETRGMVTVRLIPTLAAVVVHDQETEALREAHAGWFLRWSETFDAGLMGPDQTRLVAEASIAADDFERATRYLVMHKPLSAVQLLTRTWRMAVRSGRAQGAYAGLHQLLEAHAGDLNPTLRADACNAAGALAFYVGRRGEARRYYERALTLRRAAGARAHVAGSLLNLAVLDHFREAYGDALARIDEAFSLFEEREEPWLVAGLWYTQGHIRAAMGDVDAALTAYRTGALLFEEVGDVDATWAGRFGVIRLNVQRHDHAATRQAIDEFEMATHGRLVSDPTGLEDTVGYIIQSVHDAGFNAEAQRLQDVWDAQRVEAEATFPAFFAARDRNPSQR